MCLIFFSINQHPEYKLILAGNRDEFYSRKTALAKFWNEPIVGGCDLEAVSPDGTCGTWMAMTKTGKLAFITNYRDPFNINPKAPSRGHLVTDYLLGDLTSDMYMQHIQQKAKHYNGFNLVVGDVNQLIYFSNYQNKIQILETGFYGLSNHLLDTPWPKVLKGKSAIGQILSQSDMNPETLFDILRNEETAPDSQLPETGIGLDRERALSSMFIKTTGYGTRCSTVILVKKNGKATFLERTYNLTDFSFTTGKFEFQVNN